MKRKTNLNKIKCIVTFAINIENFKKVKYAIFKKIYLSKINIAFHKYAR